MTRRLTEANLYDYQAGHNHYKSKLSPRMLDEIRNTATSAQELVDRFNVSVCCIYDARSGRTYADQS